MLREGCSQCCSWGVHTTCWATASAQSHDLPGQNHFTYHPAPFDLCGQPELHYCFVSASLCRPRTLKHRPYRTAVHDSQSYLPMDMEPSAQPQPLKRSNAIIGKLQKEKVSAVSGDDWAAGSTKLSKALKYARKQDEKAEKRCVCCD